MRALILKAVANPPKILWGPFLPTLINLALQFPLMFMSIGVLDINPIFFLFSICYFYPLQSKQFFCKMIIEHIGVSVYGIYSFPF